MITITFADRETEKQALAFSLAATQDESFGQANTWYPKRL
jgi:hypothetical protein